MAKEFIVAIELGSSHITGMAGKKNPDGSTTVLAVARENANSCIRKGVVYNINQTAQCLTNIVNRLKTALKSEISKVYVGVGGRSIRSVENIITKELPAGTIIDQDMVNDLMDANRNVRYPDYEIMEVATQEYKVDSQLQIDPVGIQATHLEGHFENILWQNSYYRNLKKCFDVAQIRIAEFYITPLALADAVLTEAERLSGCMLVDMGAETTTVQIYYRNILRYIAVIPLGGSNVTKDIASIQTDESTAEKMKLKYASAFTEAKDIDRTLSYSIDADRSIESSTFIEIVEARVLEIIQNAWNQVPVEYRDKLLGGIILTGGMSNMRDMEKAFRQSTPIKKVRTAKFPNLNIISSKEKNAIEHDGTSCSILGMLVKGDINCAGTELGSDLFSTNPPKPAEETTATPKSQESESAPTGVKARKEAEELKRKADDDRLRQEEEKRIEEETRKKKSIFGGFGRSVKNFLNTLTEPESND